MRARVEPRGRPPRPRSPGGAPDRARSPSADRIGSRMRVVYLTTGWQVRMVLLVAGLSTGKETSLMIEAHGLTKRFGATVALDGLDLEVPAGAILGVLGPNGAGKTTAVRILTTLSLPDSGSARVAGFDVVREAASVQRSIGVTAQDATLDEGLSGRQNLVMIARLSGLRRAEAKARASELLERFDLADAADRVLNGYSGGMRRRLDLAAGLVNP